MTMYTLIFSFNCCKQFNKLFHFLVLFFIPFSLFSQPFAGIENFASHYISVTSVDISADNRMLASASTDKTIKLWRIPDGKRLRILNGHTNDVLSVSFSPDDKLIASASKDNSIKTWNIESGKNTDTYSEHEGAVNCVRFSNDGKFLVSASNDKTIKIWQLNRNRSIATLEGHDAAVLSVDYSPDDRYIISGGNDNMIKIWQEGNGICIRTIRAHSDAVKCVKFSPDGKYFASASADKSIKIWNKSTKRLVHTLELHEFTVNSIDFSPDGKYLVSSSDDNMAIVWDVETGKDIFSFFGHISSVLSAKYSPNGKFIISSSQTGAVKRWQVSRELPALYVVSIGVEQHNNGLLKLDFAADDANSIASAFKEMKGKLYSDVKVKLITGASASRSEIVEAMYWLEKQATQKDVIVVFISSHAKVDYKQRLCFLPYDFKENQLSGTSVRFKTDILNTISTVPCRKLIMIDACHAGQAAMALNDKSGTGSFDVTVLPDAITIMASSSSNEKSWERDGHGIFTRAILEGSRGAADSNSDRLVTVNELDIFVTRLIKKTTNGLQHSYTPVNNFGSFPVFKN